MGVAYFHENRRTSEFISSFRQAERLNSPRGVKMDSSGETVRSVTRALGVMKALQEMGSASLADLQQKCGLPKPTLLRLLQTLELERVVWRAQGDRLWRPAYELKPARVLPARHARLVTRALPAMEKLRQEVIWPSDLAVRDGTNMRLLETTRRSSGLNLNRDAIGLQIDILRSAVGRAYLSACSEKELSTIATQLARKMRWSLASIHDRIESIQKDVRLHGYAEREYGFGGHDAPIQDFDDQLAAIAVPIVSSAGAIGAINVVWLRKFDAQQAVVRRHLKLLIATATEIAAGLATRKC